MSYACTWDVLVIESSQENYEGKIMTGKTNQTMTAAIPACSLRKVSKRKLRIGEKISKEILANPKTLEEIRTGLAEIETGEIVVWKKKLC